VTLADTTHIILAMPHRGRLNLLTGLLEYDPAALFHKIKGGPEVCVDGETISGDVLSHLGGYMRVISCFQSEQSPSSGFSHVEL
jgi:2-oxoglutarate dehydrogenase complex dehydrogenase (E1) component-like enzyme